MTSSDPNEQPDVTHPWPTIHAARQTSPYRDLWIRMVDGYRAYGDPCDPDAGLTGAGLAERWGPVEFAEYVPVAALVAARSEVERLRARLADAEGGRQAPACGCVIPEGRR